MGKLKNDKHERFCQEYLKDLNATDAYIRVGYNKNGSRQNSSRLMANDNILARISELKKERAERIEITQDEVLLELKYFAYSDITETMDLTFDQIKELPGELRRMIASYKKSITTFDGGEKVVYEIRFIDKLKAFEMINRHIGLYEKDNEQSNKILITNQDRKDRIAQLKKKLDE